MALPFFYIEEVLEKYIVLNEETSKHIVQVLRMHNGEQLQLTNGKGNLFTCEITDNNRKRCSVIIKEQHTLQPPTHNVTIAISLLKNTSRFEWFLEKATEIGVAEIIPIICERTEKTVLKPERMKGILISAMLQSQQAFLPLLHNPTKFDIAIRNTKRQQKFFAHCVDEQNKVSLSSQLKDTSTSQIIFIGPEGDFTKTEIELALSNNYLPVTLGATRLRTETAGIAAASILVIR